MNTLSISGAMPKSISSVCYNSRDVQTGAAFVAIRGADADGHDYIQDAVKRGARVVITERKPTFTLPREVTLIVAPDTRDALARLGDYFYDAPSDEVKVLGVTGSNGKTTVTYILKAIFDAAEKKCARIGTTGYDVISATYPALTTTPQSVDLQRMLRQAASYGATYCALEVSSHALTQNRVDHLRFRSAVFTNLTQDHLDYHKTMEEYFTAKATLFSDKNPEVAVINIDDSYASRLMTLGEANLLTYGMEGFADVSAENVAIRLDGITLRLKTPLGSADIHSPLTGAYNVYNILAAVAVAVAENIPITTIGEGLVNLQAAPGRFEMIQAGQPFGVVVDYAHTDDALTKVLTAARELTDGRIITLFGCGGDRDKGKRPLMGQAAYTLSDEIIITSDNPRTEKPLAIIDDILAGLPPLHLADKKIGVQPDRRVAIREAISRANPGDLVMIAGKGHEDYQIIGSVKTRFDDAEEARAVIAERYAKENS